MNHTLHLMCHAPPTTIFLRVTTNRIDVFAVRQWPGNGADLDFRGVLKGCTAAIVAAAPIEGTLLKELQSVGGEGMNNVLTSCKNWSWRMVKACKTFRRRAKIGLGEW